MDLTRDIHFLRFYSRIFYNLFSNKQLILSNDDNPVRVRFDSSSLNKAYITFIAYLLNVLYLRILILHQDLYYILYENSLVHLLHPVSKKPLH